ncbi:hypothetical protein POTOM_001808 [Populus tomentosa]|uniref:Uncharacterized protein n=1 Tax=Populus tomentosa TaxID=118781 RepID=A0A8X8DIL0_POPTO|nr:hypothetical protein POTOM_001808 [Populus tomentosa]
MPHDTTSDTVASHTTAASKKATSCLITTVAQSHSLLFLFTQLHVAPSIAFSGPGLNAGNPVLKTYDFVSVKPLSQKLVDIMPLISLRSCLCEEAYDSFAKRSFLGLVLILNGNLCLWTGLNGIQSPVLKGIDNWMIWKSLFLPPLEYP